MPPDLACWNRLDASCDIIGGGWYLMGALRMNVLTTCWWSVSDSAPVGDVNHQVEPWTPSSVFCWQSMTALCAQSFPSEAPLSPRSLVSLCTCACMPSKCALVSPGLGGVGLDGGRIQPPDASAAGSALPQGKHKRTLYNKTNGHSEWVTCCTYTAAGGVQAGWTRTWVSKHP